MGDQTEACAQAEQHRSAVHHGQEDSVARHEHVSGITAVVCRPRIHAARCIPEGAFDTQAAREPHGEAGAQRERRVLGHRCYGKGIAAHHARRRHIESDIRHDVEVGLRCCRNPNDKRCGQGGHDGSEDELADAHVDLLCGYYRDNLPASRAYGR